MSIKQTHTFSLVQFFPTISHKLYIRVYFQAIMYRYCGKLQLREAHLGPKMKTRGSKADFVRFNCKNRTALTERRVTFFKQKVQSQSARLELSDWIKRCLVRVALAAHLQVVYRAQMLLLGLVWDKAFKVSSLQPRFSKGRIY